MNVNVTVSTTEKALAYEGELVKVVPPARTPKLQFTIKPKKGCGRVVKNV